MEESLTESLSPLESELYFLIAKFLAGGPCQEAAKVLIEELEKNEILPKRTNWRGETATQDFQTYNAKYEHIRSEHLLKLVEKLLVKANLENPISCTTPRKSLLSTRLVQLNPTLKRSLTLSHPFRNTISDPQSNTRKPFAVRQRELYGVPLTYRVHGSDFFSRLQLQCRSLGHLTAVYCVLFDATGKFIFTGADDHLVKIWSAVDGHLLASLRGNSAEITDLATNKENTLLASSSCDRYIRIWCLATGAPVATLSGHTSNVTSIFFCPIPHSRSPVRYLASTSTDGSVAFWAYIEEPGKQAEFQPKPTLYHERMRPGSAQMICSSFSPGGIFMAAGSADNNVRVYHMLEPDGPKRVLEVQPHTERVDSISWAHRGVRFISGSKDGTALVWKYDFGDNWRFTRIQSWKPVSGDPPVLVDPKNRPRVTMVGWNADDSLVLTAVSNHVVKVWNPENGSLVRVLRDHTDEIFVIEPHPMYPRVICTAGHDGQIFVWDIGAPTDPDIDAGRKVFEHKNVLEEAQGHGSVFDVKWSPDGLTLAATDSHGHILIFSCADNEKFAALPKELFFHTDYRPLTTDAITNTVLDEQTQVLPHLMPPPFLVNMDGAPYPAALQRLVPGRESCKEEQLIPNVAFAPGGQAEVIEGLPAPAPLPPVNNARSNIDEMIAQLAAEQDNVANEAGNERRENSKGENLGFYAEYVTNLVKCADPRERRGITHRRTGDVEGVRQSRGNWQTGCFYGMGKRTIIPPLAPALLARSEEIRFAYGQEEEDYYQERKNKKLGHLPSLPGISSSLLISPTDSTSSQEIKSRRLRRLAAQAAERRRQEEVQRLNEEEGIPRPNPPQQEISLPQVILRRNRNENRQAVRRGAGHGRRGGGARRAIRFTMRRDSDAEQNGQSSGASIDSSFSSSDVSEASSSESEFTDSDWGGGTSPTKPVNSSPRKTNSAPASGNEGKKRVTRKRSGSSKENEGNSSNNSDEDYEDPRPGPSSQLAKITVKQEPKTRPSRKQRKFVDENQLLDGISPEFRPSEWFGMQSPCKFPYWPQIGDDLVYFREGHQRYVEAVLKDKVYEMSKKTMKSLPWNVNPDLDPQVSCRVLTVKFEINPPRLVTLKLGVVDWDSGELTGSHINVTYHDMKDVVDFLILRQLYDKSMRHNWSVRDRFRCLIGNIWWLGTIVTVQPHSHHQSKFLLYKIRWDSKEYEVLSPWDIEVIPDAFDVPEDSKHNGILATEEDIRAGLYEVSPRDWPPYGHQEAVCDRISAAIGEVMALGIAESFLTPVDLNKYPEYTYNIPYPMDLSTIKARLDNRFYRRIEALKFDIKFIAINTETFNVSRSEIVKKSRIIRDLCLRICDQRNIDVSAEYHSLQRNFAWLSTDIDEDERRKKRQKGNAGKSEPLPGSSTSARSSTRLREKEEAKPKLRRGRRGTCPEDESSRPWYDRCKDLLETMWASRDSGPFREPVDPTEYPEYSTQIDTPMDLQSIKEDLLGGNYSSPLQFSKDVQLIFSNSKQFNTDKHSTIHTMTLRLKTLFDCQIRPILEDWKRNKSRVSSGPKSNGSIRTMNGSPVKTRTATRLRHSTSSSGPGVGRINEEVPTNSPRKNPTRSAACRNPYVRTDLSREPPQRPTLPTRVSGRKQSNGHKSSVRSPSPPELTVRRSTRTKTVKRRISSEYEGDFTEEEMEEESGPSTRFRRRSSKNYVENESEVTDEEDEESGEERVNGDMFNNPPPRKNPKRKSRKQTNGHRFTIDSPSSPEIQVRRSTRVRPAKRRRISSEDDFGESEEERGPSTRYRGLSSKNYMERDSEGTEDSEYE